METYKINQSQHPLLKEDYIENFLNKNKGLVDFGIEHPIAKMEKDSFKKEEMLKMEKYSKLYGTGYTFQLCMERNELANKVRDFPLRSNNIGLNIACGKLDKIEFHDFIGTDKPFDVDISLFRQAENVFMK